MEYNRAMSLQDIEDLPEDILPNQEGHIEDTKKMVRGLKTVKSELEGRADTRGFTPYDKKAASVLMPFRAALARRNTAPVRIDLRRLDRRGTRHHSDHSRQPRSVVARPPRMAAAQQVPDRRPTELSGLRLDCRTHGIPTRHRVDQLRVGERHQLRTRRQGDALHRCRQHPHSHPPCRCHRLRRGLRRRLLDHRLHSHRRRRRTERGDHAGNIEGRPHLPGRARPVSRLGAHGRHHQRRHELLLRRPDPLLRHRGQGHQRLQHGLLGSAHAGLPTGRLPRWMDECHAGYRIVPRRAVVRSSESRSRSDGVRLQRHQRPGHESGVQGQPRDTDRWTPGHDADEDDPVRLRVEVEPRRNPVGRGQAEHVRRSGRWRSGSGGSRPAVSGDQPGRRSTCCGVAPCDGVRAVLRFGPRKARRLPDGRGLAHVAADGVIRTGA